MPSHDIIDNRREKLLEHILRILPTTERVRFAVGYLFLSGLKPIRRHLEQLKELRLLIGTTSGSQTLEALAKDTGAWIRSRIWWRGGAIRDG